jgi:hypothetical protein
MHLPEGLPFAGTQILRCLLELLIEADEARAHHNATKWETEGDMGNDDVAEVEGPRQWPTEIHHAGVD